MIATLLFIGLTTMILAITLLSLTGKQGYQAITDMDARKKFFNMYVSGSVFAILTVFCCLGGAVWGS